jgi:DNA recombination protein RmuC
MSILTIALIVLALILVQGVGLYLIFRRREEAPKDDGAGMVLLQQQLQNLERTLDNRVSESAKAMQENSHRQFSESAKLIKEIGRQTQNFAEQLKGLQDILKNPKQRGVLGEYYLETLLKNVLAPGQYQIQYPFENGEIVDAAVFIGDKVVPVDSKFSLENYNRLIHAPDAEKPALEKAFVNDLKLRITETAKYIRPAEKTMDFAFMFIPSEGIYYDLLTNQVGGGEDENLIQRAAGKYKVIIVSPTSFLAYLQTVMQGLKAMEIEKRAEEIQKKVGELVKHIDTTNAFYLKLGNALGTVVSHFNSGHKELAKIDKDVYRITGERAGVEPSQLDKPLTELD